MTQGDIGGSTYPEVVGSRPNYLYPNGVDPWIGPYDATDSQMAPEDPAARSGAVMAMMPFWRPYRHLRGGHGRCSSLCRRDHS